MKTLRGVLEGPVIPLPGLSDPAAFRMCANGTDLFVSINEGPFLALGAGTGVPGAPDTSVQFNFGGAFGGSVNFTFDGTNATFANVAFVNDGIDLSGAGTLEIGQLNASAIRIAAAGQEVNFGGNAQVTARLTAQTITIDGLAGDAEMRIVERGADPAAVADSGLVYTKDVAAVTQLFYRDSGGTVHQLTPAAGGTPGGSPNDVQFNSAGNFDGDSSFTFDGSNVAIANEFFLGSDVTFSAGLDHAIGVTITSGGVVGRALRLKAGTSGVNLSGNGSGGGDFQGDGGNGGDTTQTGNFGGAGGDVDSTGGTGGSALAATSGGGFGGVWRAGGGAGGAGISDADGGNGGGASLTGGFGGQAFTGTGGRGGDCNIGGGLGRDGGGGGNCIIDGGGGGGGVAGFVQIGSVATIRVDIGGGAVNPPINILGGIFTIGGSFVHTGAAGDTFEVNAPAANNQAVAILGGGGEEFLVIDTLGGDEIRIGSTGTGDASISIGDAGSFIGFFGRANFGGLPNAYTVTNPTDRRSYDTTTITLAQLAEVVGTIIADHKTWNLFQ